ncbi:diphthamide biosynthesis protein [Schizopora paradoxa]|uniref:2-(3-amino-3-carboxypropyl)histidine synthase subunit 2 n=1 Tax=Schizopora paradoxa TaxID=27342 RepID=A0A0H2RIH0_9AGAM|nr:diphthamide biosynthesis protein [Schizopora paradoxa]
MSATETFSSSGEEVINRSIDVHKEDSETPSYARDPGVFEDFYEIDQTVRFIEDGQYKRVTLQFPDELLHDSVPIYRALKRKLGDDKELYVLADTSYGSCCVDEVAASHVSADAMVHYGHACLSLNARLPVLYVFGKRQLDIDSIAQKLSEYFEERSGDLEDVKRVVLKHDVVYAHNASSLVDSLGNLSGKLSGNMQLSYDPLHRSTTPSSTSLYGEGVPKSLETIPSSADAEKTLTIWVGEESPTLTKLVMISSGQNIISYSPRTGKIVAQTPLTNRLLMRRYALVQKARDADVFGILVGTLGVASYLPLISHIRTKLKKAHKKFYTISVGKINPAKLANFMEIECWVWVSCSEGMVESKDYFKPIITPFELEVALQKAPDWSGKYTFDFKELLDSVPSTQGMSWRNSEDEDEERPVFSLVSGSYRQAKRFGDETATGTTASDTNASALTTRPKDNALTKLGDSAAAHFLQDRTYQGLDPRLGQDAPSVLEQGRSGIARAYDDDKTQT